MSLDTILDFLSYVGVAITCIVFLLLYINGWIMVYLHFYGGARDISPKLTKILSILYFVFHSLLLFSFLMWSWMRVL